MGAIMLLVGIVLALCGCGDNVTRRSNVSAAKGTSTVEPGSSGLPASNPTALRAYLRGWEESWQRRGEEIWRITGGENLDFSATPDAT
jgi:hypothetical protein